MNTMSRECKIFTSLSWEDKVQYVTSFYENMIKKTNKSMYIDAFQAKVKEVRGYDENEVNTDKLIDMYKRIVQAKEKTIKKNIEYTQQKMMQQKKQLVQLETDAEAQNCDEYLATALANIQ